MKTYFYYILFAITVCVASCDKDEIDTYKGQNSVYFTWPVEGTYVNRLLAYPDSIGVSFAFIPPTINDTILMLPISVQGKLADVDRTVSVAVTDSSTAVQGEHFDLPETIVFRANQPTDSIPITFHRTPDMKENRFRLQLQLQANDDFSTEMNSKENDFTGEVLNYTKFDITISDILETPPYWVDYYFGTFTAKKLFLMSDLLGISTETFNQVVSVGDVRFYASFMKRYLAEQKLNGETVYEDDGSEMEMGPNA
ncbi:DUF4843 domain-containing protein [Joostella sp. CR20]|uniref:DUF4843 domain-containing protein n=1 Tax=Joostella sp. CR20 TaxID=2804312 RepID=UPI00313BFA99